MARYRATFNQLTPAVPFLFISHGASQSFDTTGYHIWDDIKVKTSHFNYTASQNRITLKTNSTGLYMVEFECCFQNNDPSEELTVTTALYKNGVALNDSSSEFQFTTGNPTALKSGLTIHYVVQLEKGDYLQVFTTSNDGEILTSPSTCRLIVQFIPMQGWNNSAGGRGNYTGGVIR